MNLTTQAPFVLEQVQRKLPELQVAAVWIASPANIRYLTGFTDGADAKLLVTPQGATLYTDLRYDVQARQQSGVPVHLARPRDALEHARGLIAGRPVAFESEFVSYDKYSELLSVWQVPLHPVKGLVEPFRLLKTEGELELLRRSARIADEALAQVAVTLQAGRREAEVALELEVTMRRLGADDKAFGITVASGVRGAMPHGGATDKRIQGGELVTIDMGARCGGYHSDITRTYAVGEVSGELRTIYNTVYDAQERALNFIKAGVRCVDADAQARNWIVEAGYGDYFGHSLGHGVGLNIHEEPALSRWAQDQRLEAGMVVTVEPGIYVPDLGGVRIEDLILITDTGFEFLSHAPKARL
ncbi:Xaa-Pro peptidase family protein [Deinococcus sp.]|uniref:M24 family metallopeptidase n=1 Tax=Deinococcus sp. TaxID=47478 RepID=UPI0025DB9398|nr:Xaa-Pro peptidase family protein [Deinococcus sp.]